MTVCPAAVRAAALAAPMPEADPVTANVAMVLLYEGEGAVRPAVTKAMTVAVSGSGTAAAGAGVTDRP
jgi:hypothetical protein